MHHHTDKIARITTSRGTMAKTRNSSMGPQWGIDPTTHSTMRGRSTTELRLAPPEFTEARLESVVSVSDQFTRALHSDIDSLPSYTCPLFIPLWSYLAIGVGLRITHTAPTQCWNGTTEERRAESWRYIDLQNAICRWRLTGNINMKRRATLWIRFSPCR